MTDIAREAWADSGISSSPTYVGFWPRLGAFILDLLALSGANNILMALWDKSPAGTFWLLLALYFLVMTGIWGQTLGKMVLGIKVVTREGERVPWGNVFLREIIGKFVSFLLLGFGFFLIAFDPHKQGLHDRLAHTYVVKET